MITRILIKTAIMAVIGVIALRQHYRGNLKLANRLYAAFDIAALYLFIIPALKLGLGFGAVLYALATMLTLALIYAVHREERDSEE